MTQASKDAIRAALSAYNRLNADEREVFHLLTDLMPDERFIPKRGRSRGSKNQPKKHGYIGNAQESLAQ